VNEEAKEKYGYLVAIEELPISNETTDKLYRLWAAEMLT
jgi:hypothetical protein